MFANNEILNEAVVRKLQWFMNLKPKKKSNKTYFRV